MSYTHDFCIGLFNWKSERIGDIDVRVGFRVGVDGEIGVYEVEMLSTPNRFHKTNYIPVWDWLYEEAVDWCDDHADELAADASLEEASRREDYEDMQRDERMGR